MFVHTILSGIQPDPHIIDLDQRQPEFTARSGATSPPA